MAVVEVTKSLNVSQRIALVTHKVNSIQLEEKKVNGQYQFVSHDAVTAEIKKHLKDSGLIIIPSVTDYRREGNMTEVQLHIEIINCDNPTDFIKIYFWGTGIDPQDKGIGKAISYAYKYALLKLFMCPTGDDPEKDLIDRNGKIPANVIPANKPRQQPQDEIKEILSALDNKTRVEALARIGTSLGLERSATSKDVAAMDNIDAVGELISLKTFLDVED